MSLPLWPSQARKVVMVCEPGLDYFKSKAPREVQQDVFRRHLRLARDLGPARSIPQPGSLLGLPAHSEGGEGLRGWGHHALLRGRPGESPRSASTWGTLRFLFEDAPQSPSPPPDSQVPAHRVHGHRDRLFPPAMEKEEPPGTGPAAARRREGPPICAASPWKKWPVRRTANLKYVAGPKLL